MTSDTYTIDPSIYTREITETDRSLPLPVRIVESEVDLYYRIAVSMFRQIAENNAAGRDSVFIVPVGPTFQYRRFAWLCDEMPLDLSRLHLFFMDEYLTSDGRWIDADSSLSFRGFVQREVVDTVPSKCGLKADGIHFPDPGDPAEYDEALDRLGGAQVCYAGVGINGHLAFNEPAAPRSGDGTAPRDADAFAQLPSRGVDLSRETITINSNTALGGAWDQIPARAVTVGMKQILSAGRLEIYLNRPWQKAVARKILFGPVSAAFPASLARRHGNALITMTEEVAQAPQFALR